MPAKCFVPGCKSGYMSHIKENERAGIKNPSLFSAPKDKQLLEEWGRLILRKDRSLTTKDKVCELHFEEECIERDFCNLMPDGSLCKIPRGYATLKKGSVPTIFPNLPTYVSLRNTARKVSTPLNCSSENKLKIFDSDSEIADFVAPQELNDFVKFSVEAKKILTPNSLWSVACTEDCVIFAKWDSKYCPERRVVVNKDLSTKVFLMDVEVSLPIESCTVENIAQLLQVVNDFKICSDAD